MKKTRENCYYFYPFRENKPNLCWFKNQPHIGDKCTGIKCGHYTESYSVRNTSSMDSCRIRRSSRHHDSNE